jgi:hypothetical protein
MSHPHPHPYAFLCSASACRLPPIKCQSPVASRAVSPALARNFRTSLVASGSGEPKKSLPQAHPPPAPQSTTPAPLPRPQPRCAANGLGFAQPAYCSKKIGFLGGGGSVSFWECRGCGSNMFLMFLYGVFDLPSPRNAQKCDNKIEKKTVFGLFCRFFVLKKKEHLYFIVFRLQI